MLIVARALQGVGGALLTPGSLAIIQSAFRKQDRAAAIGAWSGMAGVTTALGPVVGGWLVQSASWRYVFWINVPLAVIVVVIALRHVPESRNTELSSTHIDVTGATLGAIGLGGVTYALIEMSSGGALPLIAAVVGVGSLVAFVVSQRRGAHPMVPPSLFRSRAFDATNGLTLVVYGAMGGLTPAARPAAAGGGRLDPARGRCGDAADHGADAVLLVPLGAAGHPARAASRSSRSARCSPPPGRCCCRGWTPTRRTGWTCCRAWWSSGSG